MCSNPLLEMRRSVCVLWRAPDRHFGDVRAGVSAARYGTRVLVGSALLRRVPNGSSVLRLERPRRLPRIDVLEERRALLHVLHSFFDRQRWQDAYAIPLWESRLHE